MAHLCKQTQFPWLISNVFDGDKMLGNALQTHILTSSNGIKVGLMGLIEKYISSFSFQVSFLISGNGSTRLIHCHPI
jgi:2',3'-cyclic-nucleotide 2'-phosphodiesterase (5'-nucleotidase family)